MLSLVEKWNQLSHHHDLSRAIDQLRQLLNLAILKYSSSVFHICIRVWAHYRARVCGETGEPTFILHCLLSNSLMIFLFSSPVETVFGTIDCQMNESV